MRTTVRLSRRRLMTGIAVGAALGPWDGLLSRPAHAATDLKVRHESDSEGGRKMLALYAKGVAEMKRRKPYDPLSWQFQANIHDHPDDDPKRVFDDALKVAKTQAEKDLIVRCRALAMGSGQQKGVWKTCSHHGYQEHFLSWHRMYLYFFERIVEKNVGQDFALPYWNYSKPANRKMPASFLDPDNESNPLYFGARRNAFKTPGSGFSNAADVDFSAAFTHKVLLRPGSDNNFNSALEDVPHNQVHAAIGTAAGMGATPLAARDPIFWLHHANIDRLWESWRRPKPSGQSDLDPASGSAWSNRRFAFANADGARTEICVHATTCSMEALRTEKLGYRYDRLEEVPIMMAAAPAPAESDRANTTLAEGKKSSTPIVTKEGVPVILEFAPVVPPGVTLGFSKKAETRYVIIVEVEITGPTGGVFDMFIVPPSGAQQPIGSFNLFGVGGQGAHHASKTWRADITGLVRRNVIDPAKPNRVGVMARYGDPEVPVRIKSYRIVAR